MGGSKQTSTQQSYTGSGQAWAQPYATNAAGQLQGVYNQNQPQSQALSDTMFTGAQNLWDKAAGGNSMVHAAQGYANDLLSGKYLNGNPHLQSIIDATNQDVMKVVNGQFEQSGRYGSGQYAAAMARQLSNNEANLRYGDYNTQMQNMNTAMGQAPALAQADYTGVPEALQASSNALQAPYAGSSAYASALAQLFNGGTSNGTTTQSGGGLLSGIGSLLSGAGSLGLKLSDKRLKRDVSLLGRLPDGLGVYSYRYANDDAAEYGVMADEVARLRPWALGPEVLGYRSVDYSKLEAA